ncbi:hypothetical protein NUU61_007688 [Penicillium alfredii]|uniref:Uncharacterized protein n=1 Tax=Penicillium alfredii TaxID=1506179 RepID=A0A9W9ER80_9EURO|nr:uncharacterized protein NUU61_007688 [Penicillium alfredii]KAJ5086381.1 hypothetical protein NUU61_007688 [Penicillium alfredii]
MGKISAAAVKKYMTKPDKAKKDRKVKATKDGLEALFKIHTYPANKVQENLKKIRDTKGKTWGGNAPPQGKTYWYDRVFKEWVKLDDGFCTGKRAFNTAAPSHATRGQPRDVVTVCSLAWRDADILPILSRLKTSLRPGKVYRIYDLVRGIAGTLFHEFTHTSPNSGDEYTLDLPAKDSQGGVRQPTLGQSCCCLVQMMPSEMLKVTLLLRLGFIW